GLRYRDHHIGKTKSQSGDQDHAFVGLRDHLAHQILASDAEMHRALAELLGDFRCRKICNLDTVESGNGAAIVARAARLDELQPGTGEEVLRVLLQPALGGDSENEPPAHDAPPAAVSSSMQPPKPTT